MIGVVLAAVAILALLHVLEWLVVGRPPCRECGRLMSYDLACACRGFGGLDDGDKRDAA